MQNNMIGLLRQIKALEEPHTAKQGSNFVRGTVKAPV